MKKILIVAGAALVVGIVPAAAGFAGNSALSRKVDVRTGPTPAATKSSQSPTPRPYPTSTHDQYDDHGGDRPRGERTHDQYDDHGAYDDHGGDRPRDERTEPGDDRDNRDRSGKGRGRGSDDGAGHR